MVGSICNLLLEPTNRFSTEAIRVLCDGQTVGYVPENPEGLNKVFFPLMQKGKITVTCNISGEAMAAADMWSKGGGLVIPCNYKVTFVNQEIKQEFIEQLKTLPL